MAVHHSMDDPCDPWNDPQMRASNGKRTLLSSLLMHPLHFWHWSSRWPWYSAFFLGAVALISINEFALGITLLGLSGLSFASKVSHWNGVRTRPLIAAFLKGLALVVIGMAVVIFVSITIALKGDRTWSNAAKGWNDFADAHWRPLPKLRQPASPQPPSFAYKLSASLNPDVPPTPTPKIRGGFVHAASDVAIMMLNESKGATLRDPKFSPGMWDLDSSDLHTPLRIVVFTGDYIRPSGSMGPLQFIGEPAALERIKRADRLFGFVVFTCSNCLEDRTYWVYVKYGFGGWYAEDNKDFNLSKLAAIIPEIAKRSEDDALSTLVPLKKRVKIDE
jgi:hypothetical protein